MTEDTSLGQKEELMSKYRKMSYARLNKLSAGRGPESTLARSEKARRAAAKKSPVPRGTVTSTTLHLSETIREAADEFAQHLINLVTEQVLSQFHIKG